MTTCLICCYESGGLSYSTRWTLLVQKQMIEIWLKKSWASKVEQISWVTSDTPVLNGNLSSEGPTMSHRAHSSAGEWPDHTFPGLGFLIRKESGILGSHPGKTLFLFSISWNLTIISSVFLNNCRMHNCTTASL